MNGYGSDDDDEGFDPAFAIDSSSSPLTGGGLNELDSLSEFGSLGGAGGEGLGGLGEELGLGSYLSREEVDEVNSPSQHHHDAHGLLSSSSASLDFESSNPTARRTRGTSNGSINGAGGNASHRLSLAFELASAGKPTSSNRDLMRELGIEEDEGEEEGEEGSDYESEDGGDGDGEKNDSGYAGKVEEELLGGSGHSTPTPKGSRSEPPSPLRNGGGKRGRTSEEHDHSSPSTRGEDDFETTSLQFSTATSSLEQSLDSTNLFLSHIRSHNTDTSTSNNPRSPTSSPSTSSFTPSPPTNQTEPDYSDHQTSLEQLSLTLLRTLQDLTKTRELQTRELVELEKLSLRTPLSSLSSSEDSKSPPPSPTSSTLFDSTPLRHDLTNLRDITSSLLTALSTISELTQVNRASFSDSSRRLKSLKSYAVAAKEELQSVARSEEFVKEYEKSEKRRYGEECRKLVGEVERELEEGWKKAREVLVN